MSMQTDILASQIALTTGLMKNQAGSNIGRARVKAIYILPTTTIGSVVFKDGGASGTTKLTLDTPQTDSNGVYMLLPGEGLLFTTNIYVDPTDVTSVMVFYG